MKPSVGRSVHYTLDDHDAAAINKRRADATRAVNLNPRGMAPSEPTLAQLETGAQIHHGNDAKAGDVLPMTIVRVWGETETSSVNGQVLLDGNDTLWVTSVTQGDGERQWHEPPRI